MAQFTGSVLRLACDHPDLPPLDHRHPPECVAHHPGGHRTLGAERPHPQHRSHGLVGPSHSVQLSRSLLDPDQSGQHYRDPQLGVGHQRHAPELRRPADPGANQGYHLTIHVAQRNQDTQTDRIQLQAV